ncbi:MAG: motility protein A [Candidatus Methylomirabilis oxygeniifera]|uniref:MotA/TolQ/ExbB proton channel n=1 Tax=Methylomirabilis oxygeniifera TaxID=671143 RepID=D5MGJ5_METO1|nr:MAG: motility protein A [Candidatus Methylomirabilis oxyfera]CBE68876.1 MotA/TolQ/ExbB proton channel precursor [Candidatus Methylomirabilis oxyfera]
MDLGILGGLAIGLTAIVGSVLLDGGDLRAFVNLPAFLIIAGGTVGATMVTASLKDTLALPKLMKRALCAGVALEPHEVIVTLVDLAQTARKEGVLALQDRVSANGVDPFLRKGIELVIDGADETIVREIMQAEIHSMKARHVKGIEIFGIMGGYAPTMGIIGTVMGLVHVLSKLGEGTDSLGRGIAVAFLATFYGIFSANVLFLPISGNLKVKSEAEVRIREVMMEGVLGIQSGLNPHMLEQKLRSYFASMA